VLAWLQSAGQDWRKGWGKNLQASLSEAKELEGGEISSVLAWLQSAGQDWG
jgi:hypothetical protein